MAWRSAWLSLLTFPFIALVSGASRLGEPWLRLCPKAYREIAMRTRTASTRASAKLRWKMAMGRTPGRVAAGGKPPGASRRSYRRGYDLSMERGEGGRRACWSLRPPRYAARRGTGLRREPDPPRLKRLVPRRASPQA